MAHKKGMGSSRNGRDSNSQRRGVKKFGGEFVIPGNVIVRQCGTKVKPGENVGLGRDYTIYALVEGHVKFQPYSRSQKMVSVIPLRADEPPASPEAIERPATTMKLVTPTFE